MPTFEAFEEETKKYSFSDPSAGWFRPSIGTSKIKILSPYEVIQKHWDNRLGKSVVCPGKEKNCPYHYEGADKGSIQFLMWVIDRSDKGIKIGVLPHTVMKAISDLRSNPEYSFQSLPPFDILITKTKSGPEPRDVNYTVAPSRVDSPLTEEETVSFEGVNPIFEIVERMKEKQANLYSDDSQKETEEIEEV